MNVQIKEMMRSLKLKYAAEAWAGLDGDEKLLAKLSLDDALITLLTAEINGRAAAREAMLMQTSKIPVPADLSQVDYDDNRGPEFAKAMARVKGMSWLEAGGNICLFGSSGSGKTFVSSAIAREAVRKGRPVRFFNARDLAASLAEKRRQGEHVYMTARKSILRCGLIVLDDFCLTPPSAEEIQSLFDILNDRAGKHSVLVTSQKDCNRWMEEMGISAIGEAVAERLDAGALEITLGTGSRRRKANESKSENN